MASHCFRWSFGVALGFFGSALLGCPGTGHEPIVCAAGDTRACVCPGGQSSMQTCGANQRLNECACGQKTDGGTDAGSAGTMSGAGTGGSSGAGGAGSGGSAGGAGTSMAGTGGVGGHAADGGMAGAGGADAGITVKPYAGPCTDDTQCAGPDTCVKVASTPATSFCAAPCSTAATCPAAPTGGTGIVVACDNGHCALTCPALSTCPTPMRCGGALLAATVCAWE